MNQLIIIGNGMAGVAVLQEIVKRPSPSRPSIAVFGGEPHPGYNRVLLSDVLACAKTVDEITLNSHAWYEEHGIKLHAGICITGIDTAQRKVTTSTGESYRYDQLLIASGSVPFIPAIRGTDKRGVFTFRNIEDTEGMIRWAAKYDRAVVIGGGLLGLEAARGLTNRGMAVTVVHRMGHLMEQQLDASAGDILKKEIEKMGIQVFLNDTAEEIFGEERVEAICLSTGEILETDMILIATGIRPNITLAQAVGLAVNRGILVDDYLESSIPGIFAVGECIEHRGKTYGLIGPIIEQAKVVACSITGEHRRSYQGSVSTTTLKVAGIHLTSIGDFLATGEGSEELVYMDAGVAVYKKLVIRDHRVVGAIFLGETTGSHKVQDLILEGKDVSAIRSQLLLNQVEAEAAMPVTRTMEDSATICNCMSVTKGEIVAAILKDGCTTQEQISQCTKAATGCTTCAPLVEEILKDILGVAVVGSRPARSVLGRSGGQRMTEVAGSASASPPWRAQAPLPQGASAPLPMNKIEQFKQEKDGLDVLEDLYRYAKEGWEKITEGDIQRLKWYGLFLRNPTPGYFMMRIRIGNGIANASQFRTFAELSRRFGRGFADITTRQQIQLRNMRIEHVPEVFEQLSNVGLTTLQTGMDNIRNVMGCPATGLSPTELVETEPIVRQFTQIFLGKREYSNLPRKFNVTITGCLENCTHAETQDIAMIPAAKEIAGETVPGFNVLVGGKNGSGGYRLATSLDVFAKPEETAEIASQIILIYRDHGPRESRTKARLAFLVEEWGEAFFREELEKRVGRPLERAGQDKRDQRKKTDHVGIFRQKQRGLNYVGLLVPVGRIATDQLFEVSRLAEEYGTGDIRLTPGQNIILPNVPDARLGNLAEEPLLKELTDHPSEIIRGLVSCTGVEYCNLAVIETKNRALKIAKNLEQRVVATKPVTIQWSGCPAGCGNHTVADIGLLGKKVKVDGRVVDGVDIFVGGRSGPHAQQGMKVLEDIPCDRLEELLEGLARYVVREKGVEVLKGEKLPALLKPSAASVQSTSRWVNAAELSEFKDKPVKVAEFSGHVIAIFQVDGQFYAVDAICPHEGGLLGEGKLNGMEVICPLHGYSFHLKTGACSTEKGLKARTYPIRREGESLLVQLG